MYLLTSVSIHPDPSLHTMIAFVSSWTRRSLSLAVVSKSPQAKPKVSWALGCLAGGGGMCASSSHRRAHVAGHRCTGAQVHWGTGPLLQGGNYLTQVSARLFEAITVPWLMHRMALLFMAMLCPVHCCCPSILVRVLVS